MNFLNVHIIQTLPFSNINRDDSGSPKSLLYGGTSRARLSSQAIKRAARTDFEATSSADLTSRSKYAAAHLHDLIADLMTARGIVLDEDEAKALAKSANREINKLVAKEKSDKEDPGAHTETLVWLAEAEMRALAEKLLAAHREDAATTEESWVQPATSSLTIAGFGRMFANAPDLQTEAAVQVAHAFTTHQAVTEIDYFTAVDDLRAHYEGDEGAGHLDLAEFTSGVFYRYFNIDKAQLASNWSDMGAPDADERLKAWLGCLLLSLPSGKQNSTAAKTLPTLVLVQESFQPVSYADAFERAVPDRGDGYSGASVEALLSYKTRAEEVAGELFGASRVMTTGGNADSGITLAELLSFAANWLRA